MEIEEAIQVLKDYNIWRRSEDETLQMTDPKKLGTAIDTVVNEFENLSIYGVVKSLKEKKEMSFGLWIIKCKDVEVLDREFYKYKGKVYNYPNLRKQYEKIKNTKL